jgi:glycosyltransferase involved in cell wall biosynthesis
VTEPSRSKPAIVSVVIPVFNNEATLAEQLDALSVQDYLDPFEIIVVDNGSTDGSKRVALGKAGSLKNLRVVDAPRKNTSHARNVGARAANGELIAYCDGDDVVSEKWLSSLVEQAVHYDAVGGKLDSTLLNDEAAARWRRADRPRKDGLSMALDFLPYGVSSSFAAWADVLDDIGGWDEGFTSSAGMDVEICWRLQLKGYRLGYAPGALVHYRLRHSLRDLFRQGLTYGTADVLLYRKFEQQGIRRNTPREVLLVWKSFLLSAPDLFKSRELRGRWLWKVAYRAGRLRGSIVYRTRFL